LPALAHRDLVYTFEYTAAAITPNESDRSGEAYAWSVHSDLELPIVPRRWYVGLAHDFAAASVPGVGRAFLLGNPEIWGRGLWSSVLGLSAGGTLGVVLPVPRDLSDTDAEVLRIIRVVRPWDVAYFDDLTLTFRPSFDVRHVTGPVIFQLRQGIDWSVAMRDTKTRSSGSELAARVTFYVGVRVAEPVGLGVELWEVYELTADVPDEKRAALAISPSVRFMLPPVEPAISVLLPIASPLRGDVESYYAARVNVSFAFPWHAVRGTP
jgi:hypothetical protein